MNSSFDDVKILVGTNQVKRALSNKEVVKVYIAKNADKKITTKIVQLCEEIGVEIIYVDTMKKLGQQCNIDVGAALAAVIK